MLLSAGHRQAGMPDLPKNDTISGFKLSGIAAVRFTAVNNLTGEYYANYY